MVYQRQNLSRCLQGFEHINRYHDPLNRIDTAKILPGEYYVSTSGEMISTVLGSCISACIRDPQAGIGGMNHFMLPIDKKASRVGSDVIDLSVASRYGDFAMEKLINTILSSGGKRKNLEVKIFGGGRVVSQLRNSDIGMENIRFVHDYLAFEGLNILAEDTGDVYPRKVHYFTDTGKVKVKKLHVVRNETITSREETYYREIISGPEDSDELELFNGG